MTDAHLVRLLTGRMTNTDCLDSNAHLHMILVRGLPRDADENFLTSVFMPFDDAPLAAVDTGDCAGIVMLQHSNSVADALKDWDGWFASLGLRLSPVSGVLLGKSHEVVSPNMTVEKMVALEDDGEEALLTGLPEEIFEWDELWEDSDDKDYRQIKSSHKTKLQKAVDQNAEPEAISQQLFSLPYKLQLEVMTKVMRNLGCDSVRDLQNKLDPRNSEHVTVDIENLAQKIPGSHVNSSEQRSEERARYKCRMWKSLVCNVLASALGHALLYVVSKKLAGGGPEKDFAAEKSEITRKDRLRWLLEKVLAPLSLAIVLSFLRVKVIGAEEKEVTELYANNGVVNLMVNSGSKIMYFAVKEYPGLIATLGWLAHVASFLVDLLGAIFLCWRGGYHDQDIPDA